MAKDFKVDSAFDNSALERYSGQWADDDEMTVGKAIRFHKQRYEALKRAFKSQGLTFGAGVRLVLYDWLKRQ